MKYIDLIVQTLLAGCAFILLITTVFKNNWMITILGIQLLLGIWQLSSSFISVLVQAELLRFKGIHLLLSAIYLLVLYVLVSFPFEIPAPGLKIIFTIPAWSLAIYYYVITWHWVFKKHVRRGSFLPNVSF